MHINPETIAIEERYKLLIGGILPRPIALVSTMSPGTGDGQPGLLNVAPFSFFAGVGSNPMTLLFCPANKPDGSEKDTLINAKPTTEGGRGEFVVNVVSEPFARRMAACAEPLAYGQSEFAVSGLTTVASATVTPPRVAEALLAFECQTVQVIRTNPGRPSGGNIVLGRVVSIFAAEGIVSDRMHIDAAKLDAIGRMGGTQYCTTRDRFDMPMGIKALSPR